MAFKYLNCSLVKYITYLNLNIKRTSAFKS